MIRDVNVVARVDSIDHINVQVSSAVARVRGADYAVVFIQRAPKMQLPDFIVILLMHHSQASS